MKCSIKDFFRADEILNGKLHFLGSAICYMLDVVHWLEVLTFRDIRAVSSAYLTLVFKFLFAKKKNDSSNMLSISCMTNWKNI